MITGSLLAVLLLSAQPAPEKAPGDPVAVETQAEVEADGQVEAPVADVAVEADADAQVQVPEQEAAAAAEPEEEVVCRRRLVAAERIGERHRVVRTCRPRGDWQRSRRRSGSGD